jgi:hypothetical protein
MSHVQFIFLTFGQAETTPEDPSIGVLIGFLILLGVLVLALTRGKPRGTPEVVDAQTPDRWKDSPLQAENRRKAAAAAIASHLHAPRETTS